MDSLVHVLQWSFIFIPPDWIVIWKVRTSKVSLHHIRHRCNALKEALTHPSLTCITKLLIDLPSFFFFYIITVQKHTFCIAILASCKTLVTIDLVKRLFTAYHDSPKSQCMVEHPKYESEGRRFDSFSQHLEFLSEHAVSFTKLHCLLYWFGSQRHRLHLNRELWSCLHLNYIEIYTMQHPKLHLR